MFAFLFSELGQLQIERERTGGAQRGITKSFMENIELPAPPTSKQKELESELL